MNTLRSWIGGVVIALDQLLSASFRGSTCLTLSARAGTARRDGRLWGRVLCALLERVDHGHVPRAIKNNRARLTAALAELDNL